MVIRLHDIALFTKVESFPNTLETLMGGKNLKQFEARSDTELIDDCMWLLEKFLAKKIPQPIEMKRNRWLSNKNFLGTYSYFSAELDLVDVSQKDLAETLKASDNKPKVLFAGEATDERFPGYTHGAIASGYRSAEELIHFWRK
jgi:spermine oxidase